MVSLPLSPFLSVSLFVSDSMEKSVGGDAIYVFVHNAKNKRKKENKLK